MPAFAASSPLALPAIHPLLWRGSQLARADQPCVETGHPELSRNLPGGGWPLGQLIELLLPHSGIGELRLLLPALRRLPPKRSIVLLRPPHVPCQQAWLAQGFPVRQLLWVSPRETTNALWAAEQILKHGSCGALLYWAEHSSATALRRLHLAAQGGETAFFMFRPAAAAQASSPASLRLLLQPAGDRLCLRILKRRGPCQETPLVLPLAPAPSAPGDAVPSSEPHHAVVDSRLPDATQPRRTEPALVG